MPQSLNLPVLYVPRLLGKDYVALSLVKRRWQESAHPAGCATRALPHCAWKSPAFPLLQAALKAAEKAAVGHLLPSSRHRSQHLLPETGTAVATFPGTREQIS